MRKCMDFAKKEGYSQVELCVARENTRAVSLYEEFGFSVTGSLPDTDMFHERPMSLLVMTASVAPALCHALPDSIMKPDIVVLGEEHHDALFNFITVCRLESPYLSVSGTEASSMLHETSEETAQRREKFVSDYAGNDGKFLAAICDGEIIGAASVKPMNPLLGILNICVLRQYQGMGIGHMLMTEAMKAADAMKLHTVEAESIVDNRKAIRLLEDFGFLPRRYRISGALSDGIAYDTLLMTARTGSAVKNLC